MSETLNPAAGTETPAAVAPAEGTPPAPAAPAQGASGTVLAAGAKPDAAPAATPATWPDDWRQRLAGEDEKAAKRLERMGSPADVWKSYRALEQRLSSGEYKRAEPGENAPAEELAAWRKENGVPEQPTGYLEKLPDGIKVGDAEKPLVEAFVSEMHKQNAPPKYVHAALQAYYKQIELVNQEQAQNDQRARQTGEDELRAEWGNEFRGNTNAIMGLLQAHFGDAADGLLNARMGDGTPVMSTPGVLKGLLALAKEVNPAATIVPASAGNAGQGIEQRLGELTKMMGDSKSDYWKRGPVGEKLQAEYRQLVDAQERLKQRAA